MRPRRGGQGRWGVLQSLAGGQTRLRFCAWIGPVLGTHAGALDILLAAGAALVHLPIREAPLELRNA